MITSIQSRIKHKIPLKGFSTFKTGGTASYFFELNNKSDIKDIVGFAKDNNLKIFLLGGGSNVLFSDSEFEGLVIRMVNKGIVEKELDEDHVLVTAEAGENWNDFVLFTLQNNFFGLENLTLIPGTVGAAPVQNIGAYGIEAKDYIVSVEVFDTKTLQFRILSNRECNFGYRMSIFKTLEGKDLIVTSVTWKLKRKPDINITYKDLKEYFKETETPSPQEVSDAVSYIRSKKFPDLSKFGTAGSFFKNIVCNESNIKDIKNDFPDLPIYPQDNGLVKTSTAFILDKVCGLKGFREGNVGTFENQTLVIVNYGKATGEEVKNFVLKIKSIVKEKTKINLEEEVIVL